MNRNGMVGVYGPACRHCTRAAGVLGVALVVITIVAGLVVWAGCGGTPSEPPRVSGNSTIPSDVSEVPRITAEQVQQRLDAGANLVIVDVRSSEDYEELHIAGALSIPWEEMGARLGELYAYDEVVTYCR